MKNNMQERTFNFARDVLDTCRKLPQTQFNKPLIDQLVRSASSIGANYLEANDSLGRKDFLMRLRISRKEAKEAHYWLKLLYEQNDTNREKLQDLIVEVKELRSILSSIILKTE